MISIYKMILSRSLIHFNYYKKYLLLISFISIVYFVFGLVGINQIIFGAKIWVGFYLLVRFTDITVHKYG